MNFYIEYETNETTYLIGGNKCPTNLVRILTKMRGTLISPNQVYYSIQDKKHFGGECTILTCFEGIPTYEILPKLWFLE